MNRRCKIGYTVTVTPGMSGRQVRRTAISFHPVLFELRRGPQRADIGWRLVN